MKEGVACSLLPPPPPPPAALLAGARGWGRELLVNTEDGCRLPSDPAGAMLDVLSETTLFDRGRLLVSGC